MTPKRRKSRRLRRARQRLRYRHGPDWRLFEAINKRNSKKYPRKDDQFARYAFPLVRSIFPALVVEKIATGKAKVVDGRLRMVTSNENDFYHRMSSQDEREAINRWHREITKPQDIGGDVKHPFIGANLTVNGKLVGKLTDIRASNQDDFLLNSGNETP